MWSLALVTLAVLCASAYAQPASCVGDAQCHKGFYCEPSSNICLECLNCADYLREFRPTDECIKTISDCGPCLEGFVVDHRDDLRCLPVMEAEEGTASYYIWAIVVGVLLVVVFLIVVISVYVFKGNVLKNLTRTLPRPSCPSMEGNGPEPPPPYNPYSPLRTNSPHTMPPFDTQVHYVNNQEDVEPSDTFVKRVPSSHRPQNIQSEDNQNARPFNEPAYMRHRPPSPETPPEEENASPIHDEDTTESTWTPAVETNVNGNKPEENGSSSSAENTSELPALLAAARDTTLVEPPLKKPKPHDTNNNGNQQADNMTTSSSTHTQNAPTTAKFLNIHIYNISQ